MKVKTLSGQLVNWKLSNRIPKLSERVGSKLHQRCRDLLYKVFPCTAILEEVRLPRSRLSFDFFLPSRLLALEVQGSQHSNYNGFYHKNKLDFVKQLSRDSFKKQFCELNNIRLVELWFDESDEEWGKRING